MSVLLGPLRRAFSGECRVCRQSLEGDVWQTNCPGASGLGCFQHWACASRTVASYLAANSGWRRPPQLNQVPCGSCGHRAPPGQEGPYAGFQAETEAQQAARLAEQAAHEAARARAVAEAAPLRAALEHAPPARQEDEDEDDAIMSEFEDWPPWSNPAEREAYLAEISDDSEFLTRLLLDYAELEHDRDIAPLATALTRNTHLESLHAARAGLTSASGALLLNSLATHPSINELNLSHNPEALASPGCSTALSRLLRSSALLQHLNIADTRCVLTKEVWECLGHNTGLRVFIASDNVVAEGSAKAMGKALSINNKLQFMTLQNMEGLRDAEAIQLAFGLQSNTHLQNLNLERNNIGTAGAVEFARVLAQNNQSLQRLALTNNEIGDEGKLSLLHMLSSNPRVRVVVDENVAAGGTPDPGAIRRAALSAERSIQERFVME